MTNESDEPGEAWSQIDRRQPAKISAEKRIEMARGPRMGLGWAEPNGKVTASLQRATEVAASFLKQTVRLDVSRVDWLDAKISEITRIYWADEQSESQPNLGDQRKELLKFQKDIERLRKRLCKLSSPSRRRLDFIFTRHTNDGESRRSINDIHEDLGAFAVCAERAAKEIDAFKISATARDTCCFALVDVWERATGEQFKRYLESVPVKPDSKNMQFSQLGPLFVQKVIQAIDPRIEFVEIEATFKKSRKS